MSDDYIRHIVRDEINNMITEAVKDIPASAVDDLLGAETGEFAKVWNALLCIVGIEGDEAA